MERIRTQPHTLRPITASASVSAFSNLERNVQAAIHPHTNVTQALNDRIR